MKQSPMKQSTITGKRVRALALNRSNGRPLEGEPIVLAAETNGGKLIPAIVLATDHAGYVSFDLARLPFAPNEFKTLCVYRLGDETSRVDLPPDEQLSPGSGAIPILTQPLPTGQHIPRPQLPSIQGYDPERCFVSPNSFFVNPSARIGEGGCEILLPSNSATDEYRFTQVVRTVGDWLEIRQPESDSPNSPDNTVDEFWEPKRINLRKGYLFEYKQTWYPLGHSLGRLIYSLPLAPCESVNLAVIDWSREDYAARREDTTVSERLVHSQRRDRIIEETVKASLNEWQGGGSFMAGHAGAGSLDLGGMLSLSATDAMGGSYSSSGGERDLAASNVQKLSDNIAQASRAVRNLRSTVVSQISQQEREVIQTRTVTNHNHCHALTILYYEVLRHYRVVTECVSKQRIVFVDYWCKDFDRESAFCNRLILEPVLLQQSLRKCFDAVERLLYCTPKELLTAVAQGAAVGEALIRQLLITVVTEDATDYSVIFLLKLSNGDTMRKDLGDEHFGENERHTFKWNLEEGIRPQDITRVGFRFSHDLPIFEGEWRAKGLLVRYILQDDDERHILYERDGKSNFKLLEEDGAEWWDDVAVTSRTGSTDPALLRVQEDICCADRLIAHLNCHKVHYWNAIWLLEDPNERFYRLKSSEPFKSTRLLNYIENRPVGALGDMIAFPELGSDPEPPTNQDGDMLNPAVQCVALPAHGVFAEAQLGRCNSCEEKDITRFWDWSQSPCPEEAPQIAPVASGSRAQEINLQPSSMPNPVVNIVNPPSAPDPSGLIAAMNLLATPNIFRDMSGLQEVSDLLQKLSQGAVSLAEARQQATQIRERQQQRAGEAGLRGALQGGLEGLTPQEQQDQNMVTRNTPELNEEERADRIRRTTQPRSSHQSQVGEQDEQHVQPDLRVVDIRLRAFVTSEIWEPGFGFPVLGIAHAALLAIRFNGDNRSFSADQGTSRVDLPIRLQIDANNMSVMSSDDGRLGSFGEAEVYLATDTEDIAGLPEWAERKKAGTQVLGGLAGVLERTSQNLQAVVTTQPGSVVIRLKVAARQYFPFSEDVLALLPDIDIDLNIASFDVKDVLRAVISGGLPDLDADIRITISKREDGELQYQISGTHDGFPAWELYINGESAYQFDPTVRLADPDYAPELLVGTGDQRVALPTVPLRRSGS